MQNYRFVIWAALGLLGCWGRWAAADTLPSDVRSNHWAAPAVQEVLSNKVLATEKDHNFHGEAKVTHVQAVIALANLAHALESGTWKAAHSKAVPARVGAITAQSGWKSQPVSRYTLAAVLARMGDYVANGLPRPKPGSKDLGKSVVLPPPVKVTLPATHPAYAALTYLAANRMIWPGSPLLKADDKPVLGGEISVALSQMVAGLNDRMTELGQDEEGDTPDVNSPKKPAPRPAGPK